MVPRKMSCIAAMSSKNRGIGKDGKLPWRLRSEMKYFTRITTDVKNEGKQNAVIMGRKTWESIPAKHLPLAGRLNVVLSKTMSSVPEGVLLCPDLNEAMDVLSKAPYDQSIEHVFITGGYGVYKEAMNMPNLHRLYLTEVHMDVECDTFYPSFDKEDFNVISDLDVPEKMQEEKGIKFKYFVFEKKEAVCNE
ncbi:dihydrofolate reductase-like [Dendronephthya gigantea]|uniref:dihydrofolate reductase-like n=1 Tax=Dendronephthya gigantea TaxID=151771 RepID=UPI00106AF45A|nr:dihydrofolate reductase-like [Dendronephthya gigantea]XP_028402608.1 dihydrofolate reductase-like [Dendronephthya gigantea]